MAWITPTLDWDGVTAGKKYFNYEDWNRVENNTEYLKDAIEVMGYTPAMGAINTSWDNTGIPYKSVLNRIEGNILALKDASFEPLVWEAPKTNWVSAYDAFDYDAANRLENNLYNLKIMFEEIQAAYLQCGHPQSICGRGNTLF